MNLALLKDGLMAMVFGMGTVYLFLIVMVFLMGLMSKLLAPYKGFLEKAPAARAKKAAPAGAISAADRVLALAAIEAVRLHRNGK